MAAAPAPPCLVSLSVLSRRHGGAAGSDWQSGPAKWFGADRGSVCASERTWWLHLLRPHRVHPWQRSKPGQFIQAACRWQAKWCTVQKQLRLRTGLAGDWTAEATDQLRSNLAKAKRGAAAMLALENGPPGPPTKKQRLQASSSSSSSSSESDSDSSAEPALAASAEPPPAQSDDESSAPGTPKERLRAERDELLTAVACHQAIEDENEELKTKNLSLCEENVQLKKENCDLKKTVKALQLQLDGH